MIRIIEEHNLLSGYRFVIVEYVLVGLLLGLLGAWYVSVGRLIDAMIWLGMTANCLVIALIADATLRTGAADLGMLPLRHKSFRQAARRDHPGLWRRTTTLILITFVPFLLGLLVLAETLRDALRGAPSAARRTASSLTGGADPDRTSGSPDHANSLL